MLSSRIFKMII
uniref:Uncharacterized protein n=1 Tax=Anguilla anguilla TaxID=7936 RepID=A0A0E9VYZ5_ANGAN